MNHILDDTRPKTLFIDRDGVINTRLVGRYVSNVDEFHFIPGVLESFYWFDKFFDYIIVVTNQQGIGKGIMTMDDLDAIHNKMIREIMDNGGRIDQIYFAPQLDSEQSYYRKPNVGMALLAKQHYPYIEFENSIMIGDSESDIKFGKQLDMYTIFVNNSDSKIEQKPDLSIHSLIDFGKSVKKWVELSQ